MNAVGWTAVAVAAVAAVGSIAAAWVAASAHRRAAAAQARADERTADAEKAIAVIAQWSAIVDALQEERHDLRAELAAERASHQQEIQRHIAELGRAARELAACEKRCRDYNDEIGDVRADLIALGALVTDEITKSAVATVLENDLDGVDDKVEADAIKALIAEARRHRGHRPPS